MSHATMYVHIAGETRGRCVDRASPVGTGTVAAPGQKSWTGRQVTASAGGGQEMVFRKDRGGDSFQRQISALRQQLGGAEVDEIDETIVAESDGGIEETYISSRRYEAPAPYERERERYVYEPAPVTEILEA